MKKKVIGIIILAVLVLAGILVLSLEGKNEKKTIENSDWYEF